MTQEEVDLIYDYLHENYEYKDGELISNKNRCGMQIGKKLGYLKMGLKGKTYYMCQIKLNSFKKYIKLSQLVWIYHYKQKVKFILHLNGNIADTNIHNLLGSNDRTCFEERGQYIKPRKGYYKSQNAKRPNAYQVKIESLNRRIYIGIYNDTEIAQQAFDYGRSLLNSFPVNEELKNEVLKKYPAYVNNKTGFKGVQKIGNKYSATYKNIYCGFFITAEAAHEAYLKAKKEFENK